MSDIFNFVETKNNDKIRQNISLAIEKCNIADNLLFEVKKKGGSDSVLIIKALNLYKESLQLDSLQAQPYIGVAYITYSSGDIKNAIGILNRAREIEPNNLEVSKMLAIFNKNFQSKKEALNNIESVPEKPDIKKKIISSNTVLTQISFADD